MAEAIAKYIFEKNDKGLETIKVRSAGLFAIKGQSVSEHAIQALRYLGIPIDGKQSCALDLKSVEEADLILTMTEQHKQAVLAMFPEARKKIFTLKEYAGCDGVDIHDPYGGTVEDYIECAEDIKDAISCLAQKIRGNA